MFYTVWYLCHTIKLSARESRTVLNIADAIENNKMPIAHRNVAIQDIMKIDPVAGTAMVPFMVQSIISESLMGEMDCLEERILYQKYCEQIENAILHFLGDKGRQATVNIVRKLHEPDYDTIREYIRSYKPNSLIYHEGFTPYQDADLYVMESFVLALLVAIGEQDLKMIEEFISGESELEIIQQAEKGELGQVCWNLSMRLRFISGEAPKYVLRKFPPRWQERPDLLEVVVPYLFYNARSHFEDGENNDNENSIDDFLDEACSLRTFGQYWKYYQNDRADSFWLWPEVSDGDCTRTAIVMWQHILWSIAFLKNPEELIRRLQGLWIAPNFKYSKNGETLSEYKYLNKYQKKMLPFNNVKLESEEAANTYICSPWQRRSESFPDDSSGTAGKNEWKSEDLFHAFKGFLRNYNALKAFCTARMLRNIILFSQKEINVNYITLFLNLGDAFSCFGARNTFELMKGQGDPTIRSLAWTVPIRLLGFYANEIIDEIGLGQANMDMPAEIMRKVKNRSPYFGNRAAKIRNFQILLVYRFAGLLCAARWAFLALRDHSVRFDDVVSPWLKGGSESYAVQLVDYLYVLKDQKDEKTNMMYTLPKDSLELFYAMTEIERTCRYDLDNLEFTDKEPEEIEIELKDMILKKNLSVRMWTLVGGITPERFSGELYVIVSTNRLRALLESDLREESGRWFKQWKEMMEDVEVRSWITYLAQLSFLRLLYVKPLNDSNARLLKKAMDHILNYFAEERNDSSIYYHRSVAFRLITLDDEIGPRELVDMRARFAIQLYKRCHETEETPELYEKWRALYYYYLWGIREDLCSDYGDTARKEVMQHWNTYIVSRGDLRTDMKDRQRWDPIQDRFWAEDQERLLTIGNSFDTAMRFNKRFVINDQFKQLPKEQSEWILGIVARLSHDDKGEEYCFYFGNGEEKIYKPIRLTGNRTKKKKSRYQVGDILGVRIDEKGDIKELRNLSALPVQNRDIRAKKVYIDKSEITVDVMGNEEVYSFENAEELFDLWSGDIVYFLQNGSQILDNVTVTYCDYDNGKLGWIPKNRDFDELMLKHLIRDGRQDHVTSLTYLKSKGEDILLFSAGTGENYQLRRECFQEDAWMKMQNMLFDGEEQRGMRICVRLAEYEKFPKLELAGENAFDDINIRWGKLFNTQRPLRVQRDAQRQWIIDSEMPDVIPVLNVSIVKLPGNVKMPAGDHCNVEVAEDGWTRREMRNAEVRVTLLQTRFLNARMSYNEFKKLVDLKPGMLFSLDRVGSIVKSGYRRAFLTNHLCVECADESLSFVNKWNEEGLVKGRACIVDNVKEVATEGIIPENIEGCWPECLENLAGPVKGVLAEFTANIKTENNDQFSLKVYLDIEGSMQSVDVPLCAFWPSPDNLGDHVEAVRRSDGWVFKVIKREFVNVRALWEIKDHREKEEKFVGEPLGAVSITRGLTCTMSQDSNKPILHVYDGDLDYEHDLKVLCGVKLDQGTIQIRRARFSDSHLFPWAFRTNIVELRSGSTIFVGEAKQGDFVDGRTGWNVHAEIHEVSAEGVHRYYDLRRIFTKVRFGNKESLPDAGVNKEWVREYKEWYMKGKRHVFGSLIGSIETASTVLLRDLRVPVNAYDDIEKQDFINIVQLEREHYPRIRDAGYGSEDIRVKLKIMNGKWIASVKDTDAWYLDGELVDYFGLKNDIYYKKMFYYAGRDTDGNMIFEWGIGKYFIARNEDVVDKYGGTFLYELFFSDAIRGITFVMDPEGEYGWKAQIREEDIVHGINGMVWRDSSENIVQLLKVKKEEKGTIRIQAVSYFYRRLNASGSGYNGWQFRETKRAKLSGESQNRLREKINGGSEVTVFAQLNRDVSGKEKPDMVFDYISLDAADGQLPLLENKILCLKAYKILETGDKSAGNQIRNDYKINFYLPGELPDECETPRLVMSVVRRRFSIDESRLRIDALTDPDKYNNNNMLVSLGELSSTERSGVKNSNQNAESGFHTHYWSGSVISGPRRSEKSLKQWLAGMPSYLAALACNERQNRKAKTGSSDSSKEVLAEIAPGIICDLTRSCSKLRIRDRTLARLSLENDEICVRTVLSGDLQYFSQKKRPVELLIMDDVLNHYERIMSTDHESVEEGREGGGVDFTVAGFPQILLQNKKLLGDLIQEPLPRLGAVYLNKYRKLEVEANNQFDAGYLSVSREDYSPILKMITGEKKVIIGEWPQITFRDGTISEIIDHVYSGKWHYHDRYTGIYNATKDKMIRSELPDGESFCHIVSFFASGGRLRYTREELEIYGMSARELIEYGLPRDNTWYPIAAGFSYNVWVELFPGKVVDISVNYLRVGKRRCNLNALSMSTFGPGDELLFSDDNLDTGGQHGVMLNDFKFSGRDAIRNDRTVLSVVDVLEDGLILGGGIFGFKYPMLKEEVVKHYKGEALILDAGNQIMADIRFKDLKNGMGIYIAIDDKNRMFIPGMEDIQVSFAYEGYWKNAKWLYKSINKSKEIIFNMFEGYMPFTIIRIDIAARKIWVAYQQNKVIEVAEGQSLAVNCIGMFPEAFEDGRVILRSGGYLFVADGTSILSGVSSYELRKICNRLSELHIGFFVTKMMDGWKNGFAMGTDTEDIDICLLCNIPGVKGYVAKNLKDQSLKFLPLEKACRVKTDAANEVWDALRQRPERTARLIREDVISLIDEHKSEEKYLELLFMNSEIGGEDKWAISRAYNARVIPRVFLKEDSGCFQYLSELHPMGDIILLQSEDKLKPEGSLDVVPIPVDFIEWRINNIVAVPIGKKRRKIHFSKWFIENMRTIYYANDSREIDVHKFLHAIPRRFQSYFICRQNVLKEDDKKRNSMNMQLLRNDMRLDEILVYLYSKMLDKKVDTNYFMLQCTYALRKWLIEAGGFLSSGFKPGNRKDVAMDLIPVIAAIGLMDGIKINGNHRIKRLSVHLARMLGYACGLSIHEEQIIEAWLKRNHYGEQWNRLKHLSFGGESLATSENGKKAEQNSNFDGLLSPAQYEAITENADSILRFNTWDLQLRNTVYALLLSIADPRDYSDFFRSVCQENYCTVKLAHLGRLLTPTFDRKDAFNQLPDDVKNLLNDVFKKDTNCSIELCVDTSIPLGEELCKYWENEVRGCIILFNDFIYLNKKE